MKNIFLSILLTYSVQTHAEQFSSITSLSLLRQCIEEKRLEAFRESDYQLSKDNKLMAYACKGAEFAFKEAIDMIDYSIKYEIESKFGERK